VQKLVKEYAAKGTDDLMRYHARASKEPDNRSLATVSTTTSSVSNVSAKSLKIIKDQQHEIQHLQMQTKMKELVLEEKDIEIKRNALALRKKELEIDSYRQVIDNYENVTEADDLIGAWPEEVIAGKPMMSTGGLNQLEPPGGTNFLSPNRNIGMQQSRNVCIIEGPRPQPPIPENSPAVDSAFSQTEPMGATSRHVQIKPTVWTTPRSFLEDKGLCFSGKDVSEYPAYRHRLLTNFKELRHSRPDILLRWIESTIDGQAKRYIRNAYAVMDPGEACDVIRDTLEEVYGRQDLILDHATQQAKRQTRSVGHPY